MRRWARGPMGAGLLTVVLAASCHASGDGHRPPSPSSRVASSSPAPLTPVALRFRAGPFRLPHPIQREVAGVVSGGVALAGGLDPSDGSVGDVVGIDLSRSSAQVVGQMPQAFHDAAGAVIGGRLFVFAGGSGQISDVVQSFDPTSGTGKVEGTMPRALSDLSSATLGGVVYLVGGYDGVAPQRTIYATTDGRHFRSAGTLPEGLRYPAVAAAGSVVVIAGGQTTGGLTDTVMTFDPATGRVRTIGDLPEPLAHAMAFTIGGAVYIAGGRDAGDAPVRGMESVDVRTSKVRMAGELPSPLADAAVAVIGPDVWIFGGWRGSPVREVLFATLAPGRA